MAAHAGGLLAAYAALLASVYALFSRLAPEPYMDEPFHLGQTQRYCSGRWAEWDDKLTTFPGLHVLGATGARLYGALVGDSTEACSLLTLRAFNLLPALLTPPLLLSLLHCHHPSASGADLVANAALLSLLPTHFFYHFMYYTDSAATAAVLLLLLLLDGAPGRASPAGELGRSSLQRFAATPAAALAIALRQTNAVWVAYAVGASAVRQLETRGDLPARARLGPALRSLLIKGGMLRAAPALLSSHCDLCLLLLGFAAFVLLNGGVAVGDRSNHSMVFHAAQLAYAASAATAPFDIASLATRLPLTLPSLRSAGRDLLAAPVQAALALAGACVAVWCTRAHPFLLADNRHLSFYLWRHILSRPARRWALAPVYAALGSGLLTRVSAAQGGLRALALLLAAGLVLVPSPLLELRYLTLPVLVARIGGPPLAGPCEWGPPLVLFSLLNAAAIGLFLGRPFTWGDGTTARFMW